MSSERAQSLFDLMRSRRSIRRFATAAEIAEFAVFLLSDKAGYVNGSIHPIDGGYGG